VPLHPRSRVDSAATGARAPAMLAAPRHAMAGRAGTPPRPSRTPHAAGRSRHPRPSLSAALNRRAAYHGPPPARNPKGRRRQKGGVHSIPGLEREGVGAALTALCTRVSCSGPEVDQGT
jgi:hypothetical protein